MIYHHGIVSFVNNARYPLFQVEACVPLGNWQKTIVKHSSSSLAKLEESIRNQNRWYFMVWQTSGVFIKWFMSKFCKSRNWKGKIRGQQCKNFDEEKVDDDDGEQPECVDLVQPCADFHVDSEFKYDDGGCWLWPVFKSMSVSR